MRRGTLVLVHGAWHGSWCWDHLVPELSARGWTTSTIDLPSTSGDPDIGMYQDARAVRDHLKEIDGPVTVLAHSYGGVPVAEVADTVAEVTQLVYLAAHVLEPGEAVITPLGGAWYPPETKLLSAPEPTRELFFADVPVKRADAAMAKLKPQSARAFSDEQTQAAWRSIPMASIICDDDRILPDVFAKRNLSMADLVVHLPGSHSPFLSRPAELSDLIDEVTRALPHRRD